MFIAYVFAGLILCITIIGIPFGLQAFKIAKFCLVPFGKEVVSDFDSHPIANILWMLLIGLGSACSLLIVSIILHITIIGIPFGKQTLKLMKLVLIPFGAQC